ncbi:hypothetical protein JW911_03845 [Candidatus Peregrinibacteria bacterium]|nr:hypothetical protein [Candidatus Peregrinibacteria bacterium]
MRLERLLLLCLLITIFVNSQTANACMLASGCENSEFSLYSHLNSGISNNPNDELPPTAVIRVTNNSGNREHLLGTTYTVFTFNGNGSYDAETSGYDLEVRFDFENDGKFDTFYSHTKTASYQYKTPGLKKVRMDVLDLQGNVSTAYDTIVVVENTPPVPYFTISPFSGTPGTQFTINTRGSYDDQYNTNLLQYRFDFNGDGKFDTKYQYNTVWQHKFNDINETEGEKKVILEVRDPEGATATFSQKITIIDNSPPSAVFTAELQSSTAISANYKVDASQSKDPDNGKLQYKWDFNYNGENDIIWDTPWTTSPINFTNFYKAGEYLIKLMVKDQDGETNSSIVKIVVDLIQNTK